MLLFARAGVDVVMIPAKSGPQAVQDLMAGQVDFYFGNSSELLPHADSDKIRLVAVGTPQRIPVAPDLPTVAESFPGFEFSSWNGFSVPAGTPEEIIAAIRSEITALAKSDADAGAPHQARHRARRPDQGRNRGRVQERQGELRRIGEGGRDHAAVDHAANPIASSSSAPGRSG